MKLFSIIIYTSLLLLTYSTGSLSSEFNSSQNLKQFSTKNQNINLPDLGSSSDLSLSTLETNRIRQKIIQQLQKSTHLIEDIELSYYISQLGLKLIEHTDHGYQNFNFFLFNSPQINAFATPGGVIVLYTGLFLASESESELASVVAHEIAHVTQQHIARAIEEAQQMNVPVTLGLIAAVLLGASTSSDVGIATLTGLNAFTAQQQINFTRAHEIEADSVGIETLNAAGFNPYGMSDFFGQLQKQSQYLGNAIPEFLRTHPITINRLSDAKLKARQLTQNKKSFIRKSDFHYALMKTRLDVISSTNQQQVREKYLQLMQQHSIEKNPEYIYGYALSLEKYQQFDKAIQYYQDLYNHYPDESTYQFALSNIWLLSNDKKNQNKAIKILERLLKLQPYHPVTNYYYAHLLNRTKQFDKTIQSLQNLLNYSDKKPVFYQLLSEAYNGQGKITLSAIAQADYYLLKQEYKAAKIQLDIAAKSAEDSDYQQALINSKLKEVNKHLEKKKVDSR